MKLQHLQIVFTAGKKFAPRDTLTRNTPTELFTRKMTVEVPQNSKKMLKTNHHYD